MGKSHKSLGEVNRGSHINRLTFLVVDRFPVIIFIKGKIEIQKLSPSGFRDRTLCRAMTDKDKHQSSCCLLEFGMAVLQENEGTISLRTNGDSSPIRGLHRVDEFHWIEFILQSHGDWGKGQ